MQEDSEEYRTLLQEFLSLPVPDDQFSMLMPLDDADQLDRAEPRAEIETQRNEEYEEDAKLATEFFDSSTTELHPEQSKKDCTFPSSSSLPVVPFSDDGLNALAALIDDSQLFVLNQEISGPIEPVATANNSSTAPTEPWRMTISAVDPNIHTSPRELPGWLYAKPDAKKPSNQFRTLNAVDAGGVSFPFLYLDKLQPNVSPNVPPSEIVEQAATNLENVDGQSNDIVITEAIEDQSPIREIIDAMFQAKYDKKSQCAVFVMPNRVPWNYSRKGVEYVQDSDSSLKKLNELASKHIDVPVLCAGGGGDKARNKTRRKQHMGSQYNDPSFVAPAECTVTAERVKKSPNVLVAGSAVVQSDETVFERQFTRAMAAKEKLNEKKTADEKMSNASNRSLLVKRSSTVRRSTAS